MLKPKALEQGFSTVQMQPAPEVQNPGLLGSSERRSKAVTPQNYVFFSIFLYLVYNAFNLGKQQSCAAVSERTVTFQSCQKCDVNRHTHEKTLTELLGIRSAAAIYDFRSVAVFQCLKLGFSHVNRCMVLLTDDQ